MLRSAKSSRRRQMLRRLTIGRRTKGTMTADLLGDLNPRQREAVTHSDGPLLIVAGVGTGKTTVITRRIAWMIAEKKVGRRRSSHSRSPNVLRPRWRSASTASSRTATSRRRSARSMRSATGSCARTPSCSDLSPDYRILTEAEQAIFLKEHLFELPLRRLRPLGNPLHNLRAILTLFSRAKDEDVTPAEYAAFVERRAAAPAEAGKRPSATTRIARETELAETYAAYQSLLLKHGFVDFGDLIALALRLLREHPAVLARVQRAVPCCPGRRVPGHELRSVRAAQAPCRASQHHGLRRRRPVDLQVPRRSDLEHPRVPGRVSGRPPRRARRELPIDAGDPRLGLPPDPEQQPRPSRGQVLHSEAPARRRRVRSPSDQLHFATQDEEADFVAATIRDRREKEESSVLRLRHPRALQCRRRRVPARTESAPHPMALLRKPRALRPGGGPGCDRLPPRPRRSRRRHVGPLPRQLLPLRRRLGGPGPRNSPRPAAPPVAARSPSARPAASRRRSEQAPSTTT